MFIVTSQSEAREFGSDSEKIKAVDVTLSDGINTIVCTAFDKKAQQLVDHPLKAGCMINADLSFTVRTVKNDKGEWPVQQVRLNNFGVLVDP